MKHNHYYYIQVPSCSEEEARELRAQLASLVRVLAVGYTTVSDPSASWFEISSLLETTMDLRGELCRLEHPSHNWLIVSIRPGEGLLHSRQLGLFT